MKETTDTAHAPTLRVLTPDDFGVPRNGIHLLAVDDGQQWFAHGHHPPAPLAEAINQAHRAHGLNLPALTADEIAAAARHMYLHNSDPTPGNAWSGQRCIPIARRGAIPITVVSL